MSRHRRQQRKRMRRGTFWMHGKELVVRRHVGEQIRIVRNAAWGDDYLVQCHRGPIGRHYVPWCETREGRRLQAEYSSRMRSIVEGVASMFPESEVPYPPLKAQERGRAWPPEDRRKPLGLATADALFGALGFRRVE